MPLSAVFPRRFVILAVGVGLAFLLGPHKTSAQASGPDVQVPDTADAVVRVRDMACSACAQRMKSALEDVDGVDRASVSLEKQNVVLTLGGKSTPTEKTLREAVTSAGYEFRAAIFAEARKKEGSTE